MRRAQAPFSFGALAASLVLVACAPVSHNGSAPSQSKILRVVGAQEIDTLNPLLSNEQYSIDCSMFWAGYLFTNDEKGRLVPELASQVPTLQNGGISADGLTITYHLRRGVLWQDGAPFSARDVRFTWRAVMNPNNNVANRTGYDRIRDVEIVNDYTVRLHLTQKYAPAVDTLFAPSAGPIALLPAHLLEKYPNLNRVAFNVKPIGTGPFIVDGWEQGVGVSMHANPRYWRGRPKLDGVRFLTVHDNNTMLIMMRSGDADLYYRVPDGQIPELPSVPNAHKIVTPFIGYEMLLFNTRRPPLDDRVVRQAIAYATDKRKVISDVTLGSGTPTSGDQPPWLWASDPNLPRYEADPDKARLLLSSRGWLPGQDGIRAKFGRRLSITISTPSGFRDGTQFEGLFQQWMRTVGVEVEVENYPSNLLYATYGGGGMLATGKFDAAFIDWYNGIDPDDSVQWGCGYVPPAGQNFAAWCDPAYDAAEKVALASYDTAVRKRAYGLAQMEMAREVPADFLYFIGRTDLLSNRLVNYRPAPAVSTFWNTWEYDLR